MVSSGTKASLAAPLQLERLDQPLGRHAARLDQRHHQQENDRHAQGPRIAPGQIGAGRAHSQAPHRLAEPVQMAPPQHLRRRILSAAGQAVAEQTQGLMRQLIDLLETPQPGVVIRPAQSMPRPPRRPTQSGNEQQAGQGRAATRAR